MSDDLTLQQRLAQAEAELSALRNNCQALNAQLTEIRATKSYKLSRFIRFVCLMLTFNRNGIREYVPVWRSFRNRSLACRDKHKIFYCLCLAPLLFVLERVFKPLAKLRIRTQCTCSDTCRKMLTMPQTFDGYQLMYENNEDYSAIKSPVRCVAFYLPQYHTFPENDQWWGKGFTEWVNTSKSKPRYKDHYQPREPHADWGYYDLSDVQTLKKQSALAKEHHIDAFCFYYYWFDNKTLMEKPMQLLLQHPEIDQEFCLCWANENWTRAWDGNNSEILIAQDYNKPENDLDFIKSIAPYLKDRRYMRVDNAAVLLVYRLSDLPDPGKTIKIWKDYCRSNGIGELKIWSVRSMFSSQLDIDAIGVDAEVEFPPHPVTVLEKIDNSRFAGTAEQEGNFYNYESLVNNIIAGNGEAEHIKCSHNIYRCAMLGWDNSARRSKGWSVWYGFSRVLYYRYLRYLVEYTKAKFKPSERIVFINAWNEWAEGTYLEPDKEFGYAGINITSRALLGMPECSPYQLLSSRKESELPEEKILIHFHCFYEDLAGDMLDKLNNMPCLYDCIITTDTAAKKAVIEKALQLKPLDNAREVSVTVCPNIGRDVAPFICSVTPVIDQYTLIGHFHTKKSDTVEWGDHWRNYLWDILLGSPEKIRNIFARFAEQEKLGLVFPPAFPMMKYLLNWSGTRERCAELMEKMNFNSQILPEESPIFPAGQMFWARVPAIRDLFRIGITCDNFERELGQVEHTLGHAVERLWCYVARANNFDSQMILHTAEKKRTKCAAALPQKKRITLLVHYNAAADCSPEDIYLTKELSKISDVYVISNSKLTAEACSKLEQYASGVIIRGNEGFDFAAWRDGIKHYAREVADADELLLVNNSCIGPFRPFEEIFGQMEDNECDFWGMSEFPELQNSLRPEAEALPDRTIPAHLQSYFLVLRKRVLQSPEFSEFWKNFENHSSLLDVVANGELKFTEYFKKAGFRAASYFPLSAWLQMRRAGDIHYNAIYDDALDFLFLGFPMMKKNANYCLYQPELLMLQNYIAAMTDYPAEILNFVSKKN